MTKGLVACGPVRGLSRVSESVGQMAWVQIRVAKLLKFGKSVTPGKTGKRLDTLR